MQSLPILNCPCNPMLERQVGDFIAANADVAGYTVAINAEKILAYQSNVELRSIIQGALLPYPDGVGAVLGLRWLHGTTSEKINMPVLCLDYANENKVATYIVGASEQTHLRAIENIKERYPEIELVGHLHGYHPESMILEAICETAPSLVLIAMGSPKQEQFAAKLVERLDKGLVVGCGGALDIIAGDKKRAPNWMINNGLEWAYRLKQEPWRIKRQLFLALFLVKLVKEAARTAMQRRSY